MKETKNRFYLGANDNCNCTELGWHEKASKDRCPECGSDCLYPSDNPQGFRGECAKCGFYGKKEDFQNNKFTKESKTKQRAK